MTFAKKIGKDPGPIGKTGKVLERGLPHSLGLPPGIKGRRDLGPQAQVSPSQGLALQPSQA